MDEGASPNRTNIFKKITDFMKKPSKDDDVTEEEIISMVNEGHEQGVLHETEAEGIWILKTSGSWWKSYRRKYKNRI